MQQSMAGQKKDRKRNRIPIRFADEEVHAPDGVSASDDDSTELRDQSDNAADSSTHAAAETNAAATSREDDEVLSEEEEEERDDVSARAGESGIGSAQTPALSPSAGPVMAELVATRAELKRVEAELNEAHAAFARRQADFDNYRKRQERERSETYARVIGEVASKLLPVMDNLQRALDAEASVKANESEEFHHFLHGVELISKQLNDLLGQMGVQPVTAIGAPFDPHVHEAISTEQTDEYAPDTVIQEIVRGYRIGNKLLRPAMVKVATRVA
jgi:molecular chaperone GrpE